MYPHNAPEYTAATVVFRIINATVGLRASAEEEITGLDITEHGLSSAYADFLPSYPGTIRGESASKAVDVSGLEPLPLSGA